MTDEIAQLRDRVKKLEADVVGLRLKIHVMECEKRTVEMKNKSMWEQIFGRSA